MGNDNQKNIMVNVPADGSCLFWSVALAYLKPVINIRYTFLQRYRNLFGSADHVDHIRNLIRNNNIDDIFIDSIRNRFRNRVVDYMRDHRSSFEGFMEGGISFESYLQNMRISSSWGGEPEIKAITDMLDVSISVTYDSNVKPMNYGTNHGVNINLYHTGPQGAKNHYNFALPRDLLNENDLKNLEDSFLLEHQGQLQKEKTLSFIKDSFKLFLEKLQKYLLHPNIDGKKSIVKELIDITAKRLSFALSGHILTEIKNLPKESAKDIFVSYEYIINILLQKKSLFFNEYRNDPPLSISINSLSTLELEGESTLKHAILRSHIEVIKFILKSSELPDMNGIMLSVLPEIDIVWNRCLTERTNLDDRLNDIKVISLLLQNDFPFPSNFDQGIKSLTQEQKIVVHSEDVKKIMG